MTAGRITTWIAGALLLGLYVYATIAAVGNYVGMTTFLGGALSALATTLLIAAIGIPTIALIVALVLARGRGGLTRLLLVAAGLCVTAAIHLEIMHLIS